MAPRRTSRPLRSALIGAAALTAGVAATAEYARRNNMLGPRDLMRYALTPNSQVGRLFPARTIRQSPAPRELPVKLSPIDQLVPWKGAHRGITRVLRETKTNAFLVARDGVLVHSWLRDGFSEADQHSSWSVAKSVVGLIVGQLIADGKLSEDTRLTDLLPEFTDGGHFDTITVRHLLDMQSGIDLAENYTILQPYSGVAGMLSSRDITDYLHRTQATYAAPGELTEYRSVDTQYLSMMATRVAGIPLSKIVERQLWGPMGAHDTATWNLDSPDGIEKGFASLNASARDYLKIGQLMLDEGRVGDTQVVPKEWIERIRTPAGHPLHDIRYWGYSAQWWHPEGYQHYGDFTALGVYGQYIYVNPKENVVIVKLSDYGTEKDEDRIIRVFRAVASHRQ